MIQLTDQGVWVCDRHEDTTLMWCNHIREYIENGDDSRMYHLGMKLDLPIYPDQEIWVQAFIDAEPVVARSAMWHIEYQPDIGNLRRIEMGLWNPGEGARSMRTVVVDWIKGQLSPNERLTSGEFKTRCPNNAHSIRSSRIMAQHCDDASWKWKCLWNIVMERACTPCIEEAQGPDDNYGIDQSVIDKPRWAHYSPGTI